MTLKNTKMLLFTSLIVTMILPFSGMQFAQAEMSDSNKARLIAQLEKIVERIENTTNESLKEHLEAREQVILEKLYRGTEVENLQQAVITETSEPISTDSSTIFDMYGTRSGCDNRTEVFNFKGDYNSGATQISITQNFPNNLTSGDSPNCEEHEWEDNVYISIKNIWDNSGCVGNMDVDPVENYKINCATLGGIYVIKVTADYDGKQFGSYSWFWA